MAGDEPKELTDEPSVEPTEVPDPPEWNYKRPAQPTSAKRSFEDAKAQRGMGIAMSIGFAFVVPVLLGAGIGSLLDRGRSGNLFMMLGVLLGTVVGFVLLIRLVNKLNEDK